MSGGIARQAFTVLFARGFIRIAQLVSFFILARFMTTGEFGWFGILTTAMALAATLGSLGIWQSFTYEIGQKRLTAGEAGGTAIMIWPVLASLAAAAVFAVYGRHVPGVSNIEAGILILLGVGGMMLMMLMQGVYLGRGDIKAFSLSETLPRLALMLLALGLALTANVALATALWAHAASYILIVPIMLWLALRGAGKIAPRLDRLGAMLKYGLILAFNLFLNILSRNLSMFVIAFFSGTAAAGLFFAAIRLSEIFLEAAAAMGMVLFSDATRQAEGASVLARNARIACWMFWLFLMLAGAVALAATPLLTLLLGAGYAPAGAALQIMALGLAPAAGAKIIYPTIAGRGRPLFGTPVLVVSLLVTLALAWILVPSLGIEGGAWALVAGQYVLYFGYVASSRIFFGVPVRDFIVPRSADMMAIWHLVRAKILRFSNKFDV